MKLSSYCIFSVLFLLSGTSFSQEAVPAEAEVTVVDSLYREDQFYFGVTFNLLHNTPQDFTQNGLSGGFQTGFIRDIPLNKRRNKAIGIGLGFAFDTYNQNLLISSGSLIDNSTQIIDDAAGEDLNRFTTYSLEVPIQYRWRTSTPARYTFWRIHAGLRLGYIARFRSLYRDDNGEIEVTDAGLVNRLQYGPTFAFGYGAFNFQAYYGFNPLFSKDVTIDEAQVNLQVIRLGLVFYFL